MQEKIQEINFRNKRIVLEMKDNLKGIVMNIIRNVL